MKKTILITTLCAGFLLSQNVWAGHRDRDDQWYISIGTGSGGVKHLDHYAGRQYQGNRGYGGQRGRNRDNRFRDFSAFPSQRYSRRARPSWQYPGYRGWRGQRNNTVIIFNAPVSRRYEHMDNTRIIRRETVRQNGYYRDRVGDCFERRYDSRGREILTQLPASACRF